MSAHRSGESDAGREEECETAAAESAQSASSAPADSSDGESPDDPSERAVPADPEAFALRGRPVRAIRFRREIVIGTALAALLAVTGTVWFALRPVGLPVLREPVPDLPAHSRPPEILAQAPASYDAVPLLGPPLPGDLGRPILKRQRSVGTGQDEDTGGGHANAAEAERTRAAAAALEARESDVFLPLGRRGEGRASAPLGMADPEPIRITGEPGDVAVPIAAARSPATSPHRIVPVPSPWVISGGSVLAASLVTAIDSDSPGLVVAQLTEHAYDSATGRTLLLPQGSRLIGRYESDIGFGERRLQVVWQRIVLPDGASLLLDDLPAGDARGQAGLSDRVDSHPGQLARGVVLSTLLGAATELSLGDDESELVRALREGGQRSGARAGEQLVGRALDVAPTIRVRPGWPLSVIVHRDLVLQPWRP